ncbi:MAG: flagellar assembly protein FliH [Gammaproteobacteria bacterium]|nr:flagellar assembly protein FliH [Gammaproteobacteria bacterium]
MALNLHPAQSLVSPDAAEAEAIHNWPLPDVATEESRRPPVNPFGLDLQAKEWPADDDQIDVKPLTAEELEAIRESARDEGLAEGRMEGLKQGHAEGFSQGRDEGLTVGREEGHAQGLAAAKVDIDRAIAAWEALAKQLEKPLQAVDLTVERQLVALVAALAKAVIRTEVATNPDVIHAVIREAVSVLPLNTPQLVLTLSPEDRTLVEASYSESQLRERGWKLRTDAALARGDCQLETETSRVEVRLEETVKELLERFLHQRVPRIIATTAADAASASEVNDAAHSPTAD